ncbi:MAG TPA: hypothetical protein VNO14_00325 [Blastocatellia bacterium]|nr:hypothetical protein [Blastocatellia bacterium]
MKVEFENMNKADQVLIRTQNSEYCFEVLDPQERRGLLTGGSLGGQMRDAVLIGAVPEGANRVSDPLSVRTGARAMFFMNAKNGVERLITSVITEIKHLRNKERMRVA